MRTSDRATCTRLRQQKRLVHVERDSPNQHANRTTLADFTGDDGDGNEVDGPVRKQVYVPAMNAAITGDEPDTDEDDTSEDDEGADDEQNDVRNELLREFAEATGDELEEVGSMFGDVVDEIRDDEEEQETVGSDEDASLYMLFETNHPDIDIPDEDTDDVEKAHMVSRVIRLYNHRWTIENGFKQVKSFRVRTTSMKYEYRFFNFLYACTMYNVWRLVDTLVKLELEAEIEFRYKPLVTANLFLTIAKDYQIVGLDPPD
jgi:IS4 transposase